MIEKKKVLLVCYACEPNKSSEPGVGWNFSREIAKFVDVTVLTRANNKSVIEAQENPYGIEYIYHDLPKILTRAKKKIPFGIQLYFMFWQWSAYRKIRTILKRQENSFDLVHHLTFATTKNIPMAYKFKTPFIWGPIGGGDTIPYTFLKEMGPKGILDEFIYRVMHWLSNLSIRSFLTRKKAKAIAFRTASSMNGFPQNGCKNRFLISETANARKNCRQNKVGKLQIH